jgi:hypothetical protein
MFTRVYVRGVWIAVMSGLVVLLAALLVVVSQEAVRLAAELSRRTVEAAACDPAYARTSHEGPKQAAPPQWTARDAAALEAQVQAIVVPHDGQRRAAR